MTASFVDNSDNNNNNEKEPATVVIAGAGIVGLVLALCLKKHVGITAELYERAPAFHDDVGAGMGMYANGFRVIRDIDPQLLQAIKEQGQPYKYRRWERHDGSLVMSAEEEVLHRGDDDLESVGIRRWRLQKVLYEAVQKENIPVHFSKETMSVETRPDGIVELFFTDGTSRQTQILFAADGAKSTVRKQVLKTEDMKKPAVAASDTNEESISHTLTYTGTTCLMGIAEDCTKSVQGISFTTSTTTKCHSVFFPTGGSEQCFQFHFSMPEEELDDSTHWGTLSPNVGQEQCRLLADRLRHDGWEEQYMLPLDNCTKAIKIGLARLNPQLTTWVFGNGRIVLLGDAAHPPEPYLGQGSQLGMEDAGTIALLMKEFCLDDNGQLTLINFARVLKIYERIRIPRASDVLDACHNMGKMHQKRAELPKYDIVQGEKIQRQVFYHETLPEFLPGVRYDYKSAVGQALDEHPNRLTVLMEGEENEE